jgi:aminopeptidase N
MNDDLKTYLMSDAVDRPIIDSKQHDLLALLNPNSCQKAGWVLHMLRTMLGDRTFFRGIQTYYSRHRLKNATTDDLRTALEMHAGRSLRWFFRQWLYAPGYPRLRTSTEWDSRRREVVLTIEQTQPTTWPTYRLPLVIQAPGLARRRVEINQRRQILRFRADRAIDRLDFDPDGDLLTVIEP